MSPFKRRLLDTVFQGATLVRVADYAARTIPPAPQAAEPLVVTAQ